MTRILWAPAEEAAALSVLREQIRAAGLSEPTPAPALTILLFHFVVMTAGIIIFAAVDAFWIRAAALLVSTYGALGIGMSGHNASHHAVTGSRRIDRALTFVAMTVLNGISEGYWREKHIRMHHAGPNNIGIDYDIDLKPFFVLNQEEMARARGWPRRIYRIQHWIFPFAISLNLLNLQLGGVRHLIAVKRGGARWGSAERWDVGCLILHLVIFLIIPALVFAPSQVIEFYVLREILNGYASFVGAAPAHFPAEAVFVEPSPEAGGRLARQIYTTINFRTGFWGRLVCIGAEHQIEHHLLPDANPLKLPRVSRFVQDFCRQYGYPYRCLGWWEGILGSLTVLKHPKPVLPLAELVGGPPRR